MVQVNREVLIFCLQSIAQQGPGTINADKLIEVLSAFISGIELVKESKNMKTYKVGNFAFELFYDETYMVEKISLYEKYGLKVFYLDLLTGKFFNETDCYPDCLK